MGEIMKPLLLRSLLYMPAINARALEKAHTLNVDGIIADLEDGVAISKKHEARKVVAAAFSENYDYRLKILRINALGTPYINDDLHLASQIAPDAILLSKVNSVKDLDEIIQRLNAMGATLLPLWLMIETPSAILNVEKLAQNERVTCLVMGTNDLGYALHSRHIPGRIPFLYSFLVNNL